MAEYYMTYKQISELFDTCAGNSEICSNVLKYKAEVLAAITGNYEQNDFDAVNKMIDLWNNQIKQPSQLLLGDRYISIESMLLDFFMTACTSGFLDELINSVETQEVCGFTISICSSIAIVLWELFNRVKRLDDWDFCVYMQAVTHYSTHRQFTKDDLLEWFPHNENRICNMHNDQWDCEFLKEDDTCAMLEEDHLDEALESLFDKNLLKKEKQHGKYTFQFKR